jgi:ribonuclease HII
MITATFDIEKSLWSQGFNLICGIDEVGRGCFAGPVVAGAVIFSPNSSLIEGVADSKLLKPGKREDLCEKIKEKAAAWAVGEISVEDINKFGIGKATQMAFSKAVENLQKAADFFLIDAFYVNSLSKSKQRPVKGGDRISASIAAASIIAKVYRDKLMEKLAFEFPDYGFDRHKGYGTDFHRAMIKKFGLSKLHRKSFNLSKFV